ncbi:hypothetical protein T02_1231 [Trichinella nativa]|uniref:Uncharacterized protein n=1 Tax=Trichinella nativa TaxID=6335 RepID=A0A0V1KNC6_9BILA|nr:hypothetical protein T02_1231 [Trichinella nativa]
MEKKEEKSSKPRASERMVDRYDLPKSSVKGSSLQRHNE